MADSHKNFASSLVATAPSPASSGTSLVVTGGEGTKFPTAPFNATVWPAATQPTTANAEIVRVTAISTDTLTITRAQESSSARTIVVGDQVAATITAQTLTDVETLAAAHPYRTMYVGAGILTAAATIGPKYHMVPGIINTTGPIITTANNNHEWGFNFVAARQAVTGLTTKFYLEIVVVASGANASAVGTFGLYPITAANPTTLGTLVSGSTVAITAPGVAWSVGNSGDFTVPSDDVYGIGCVVSGAQFTNTIQVQYRLMARNV